MSSSQSFPKTRRLRRSGEFRALLLGAEVFKLTECMVVRKKNSLGHYRVGITVRAKARAIDRNRAKRQIREWFRLNSEILGAFDYNVVVPRSKDISYPYWNRLRHCLKEELQNELVRKNTRTPH